MNEHLAEDHFCKDVRAAGGLALKTRSRFQAGFLDLFVKMPGWHGVFIECKYEKWRKTNQLPLNLSALQIETIKRFHDAGQSAGWLLFTKVPDIAHPAHLSVLAGTGYNTGIIECEYQPWFNRPRGGTFPINDILKRITVRT